MIQFTKMGVVRAIWQNRPDATDREPADMSDVRKHEPRIADTRPAPVELEAGRTYYWCTCGRSKDQPFCDGSHKGTDFTPVAYKAEKTGTAYLCGCKRTSDKPMCDGSHNSL